MDIIEPKSYTINRRTFYNYTGPRSTNYQNII